MDLTIARLRQIKQAIEYRQDRRSSLELARIEWQTKALMLQLAGLAQSEKQARVMQDIAMNLQIKPGPTDTPETFDPEAEPDYSKMNLKPTSHVMRRMGRLEKPKL